MIHKCDGRCTFVMDTCPHRVDRWKGSICRIKSSVMSEHTSQEIGDVCGVTRQWIHQTINASYGKIRAILEVEALLRLIEEGGIDREDAVRNMESIEGIDRNQVLEIIKSGSYDREEEEIVVDVIEDGGSTHLSWTCPFCHCINVDSGTCKSNGCGTSLEIELPGELRSCV